ncbi:SDR family oxidoreductase [Allokutzneria albata]|uniref:3-oxoacyl-[acyl-carrier protein] reductase n=1 Tax=Allokutzneria albata TaxID=211114 RepID=A0A1G9QXY7_ALLAB|nr:SDR family oxidoreductase [Allokutzneria albata]SDM15730.1 3-oxoacyl-[acyl-carrier protein] reductase [Allokutzneria albata]
MSRAALVTGGSRGIGRAIVRRLARDGAHVVFSYVSNAEAAAEVERLVAEEGGKAHAVQADLSEPGSVEKLFEAAGEHLDGLDILVNNAGTAIPKPLPELTEADFDLLIALNTKAVFLAVQHAARHMRDDGRIITVSTANVHLPFPGTSAYGASKAAAELITQVAARELGSRGITANVVRPGTTETDLLLSSNRPEVLEMLSRFTTLGRIGQPADVADVVAFLAGPDARWLTGEILNATGGLHA